MELQKKYIESYFEPNDCNYIISVGNTGSGKTYNAINRLKESTNGVYLCPLRLLAWEVYEKMNLDGFRCNLVTGEEQLESANANFTASTIEMLDFNKEHDCVIIDECFMVGDVHRGKSWFKAIMKVKAKEVHIITNYDALELIKTMLSICNRKFEVKEYKMLQNFTFDDKVFSFSKNIPDRGIFITFSRVDVILNKMKLQNLGKKVSVLYGNLPPQVKKTQIENFISGKTQLLVSTDVIGMGINVPCDYIVFLEDSKFDGFQTRKLNPSEVKQISGRTGRYGLSSDKSFVSATSYSALNHIKSNYEKQHLVSSAYIGLDFDFLNMFPDGVSIHDRLKSFQTDNFIPSKLGRLVVKESVSKYHIIYNSIERYNYDLKTNWTFMTAPTKRNNEYYFQSLLSYYKKKNKIIPPSGLSYFGDAKLIEDKISEIELYLNLTRNLAHDENEKIKMVKYKESLIEKLDALLLNKKLANKKKCKLCNTMLPIIYPYPYCEDCYENKVSNS